MRQTILLLWITFVSIAVSGQTMIHYPAQSSMKAELAAKELRRYIYQRTGDLPTISNGAKFPKGFENLILITEKSNPVIKELKLEPDVQANVDKLAAEQFYLKSFLFKGKPFLLVCGGDSIGMLYGAYRFAEILGVRFYLHGDVIPDNKIPFTIPEVNEFQKPMFGIRGIQPFHDFAEGPDWWEQDNYLAIIEQLPKLKMNFIGLHTYTDNGDYVRFEPNVWQGLPGEYNADGTVNKSYPTKYANTGLASWGYRPRKTSDYSWGADMLFEKDYHTSSVMDGLSPIPNTPEKMNQLFNRTAALLNTSFKRAHALGVKTCVGTEVPLSIHYSLTDELKKNGKAFDSAYKANVYKGIFGRIEKAYPIDYYWFWTSEGWTWNIPTPEQQNEVVSNLRTAVAVHKEMKPSFKLATCGWVLGPPNDRALFDKVLPKEIPTSCINRYLGYSPVDVNFASVSGREKWAIPWLEDDPRMISPQFWVGRVRRDAADAYAYGCNGLMGIHWRTDIISPNIAALAQAQWSHTGWNKKPGEIWTPKARTPVVVEGTDDDAVYGTLAYNPGAYEIKTNEDVSVTLMFCETVYDKEAQRLFDILINDSVVKADVDVYKLAGGKNRSCDITFNNIKGKDVKISFRRKSGPGYPMISGLIVEGKTFKKKINCSSEAYKSFEKDLINPWDPRHVLYGSAAERDQVDYLKEIMDYKPVSDFYVDWCLNMFGPEISTDASRMFGSLDGNFPVATEWRTGPGNVRIIYKSWTEEQTKYSFVDGFERYRKIVKGPGNTERFEFWLSKFKYQRALAHLGCVLSEFEGAMKLVNAETDNMKKKNLVNSQALPLRIQLMKIWGEAQTHLMESINTTGDLGVLANLDNHSMAEGMITRYDSLFMALTWQEVPKDGQPSTEYKGRTRIIVPAVRNSIFEGETFRLKMMVIGKFDPTGMFFWWKKMGSTEPYQKIPLKNVTRGVYVVEIPATTIAGNDFEYYISVIGKDANIVYPASAPQLNQSVIVVKR